MIRHNVLEIDFDLCARGRRTLDNGRLHFLT